jgi:hypothetical protein
MRLTNPSKWLPRKAFISASDIRVSGTLAVLVVILALLSRSQTNSQGSSKHMGRLRDAVYVSAEVINIQK